jgi:hypothetical protein
VLKQISKNLKIMICLSALTVGIGSMVYGFCFHSETVFPKEDMPSFPIPAISPLPDLGSGFPEPAPIPSAPPEQPADQPEYALVRIASVGGLKLDEAGTLRKTYSGDAAPSACPT